MRYLLTLFIFISTFTQASDPHHDSDYFGSAILDYRHATPGESARVEMTILSDFCKSIFWRTPSAWIDDAKEGADAAMKVQWNFTHPGHQGNKLQSDFISSLGRLGRAKKHLEAITLDDPGAVPAENLYPMMVFFALRLSDEVEHLRELQQQKLRAEGLLPPEKAPTCFFGSCVRRKRS